MIVKTKAKPQDELDDQFMNSLGLRLRAEEAYAFARENLYDFSKLQYSSIGDRAKESWWQMDCSLHLEQFYEDLKACKRPKLILMTPPQHGKSRTMTAFQAWLAGKDPDLRLIFASYSDDLGMRTNLALQRILTSPFYRSTFSETKISEIGTHDQRRYVRNASLLEFVGRIGSFRNTTIMGQINGMSLDVGIIDDPIKGRVEANSKTIRERTWSWLTDDFFGRFSENAGFIMILTRWHLDDPAGRWLERFPETKVLRYPAIAEEDSHFRLRGDALFPEHKSIEFLAERRRGLSKASFEAQYQQNPIVVGGDMFPVDKIKVIDVMPNSKDIQKTVRYWDKAGTEDGGAYTAGVLMHKMQDNTYLVEHVMHGQWGALDREKRIKQSAELDQTKYPFHQIYVEQEPGSGGKESAESTIRMLAGFAVFADKPTGDKVTRADPFAAQVQAGNVSVLRGNFTQQFLDELEHFPAGKFKDQVDAATGAFNKMTGSRYDTSWNWV